VPRGGRIKGAGGFVAPFEKPPRPAAAAVCVPCGEPRDRPDADRPIADEQRESSGPSVTSPVMRRRDRISARNLSQATTHMRHSAIYIRVTGHAHAFTPRLGARA